MLNNAINSCDLLVLSTVQVSVYVLMFFVCICCFKGLNEVHELDYIYASMLYLELGLARQKQ